MGEKDDDYPPDEGRLADGWRAAQPGDPAGKATDEIRERQIIMIIIMPLVCQPRYYSYYCWPGGLFGVRFNQSVNQSINKFSQSTRGE